VISSQANPKIKTVRRLQAEKRFREKERAFVVEGTRWLAEVAHFGITPHFVLYTETWSKNEHNRSLLQQVAAATYLVDGRLMGLISDTESAPGVLAVLPMFSRPLPSELDLALILDQLTNPGNMGTMLRTAAAAGAGAVFLAPGCVDVYNPKVVRAGMGAHLRLPLREASWPEIAAHTAGMRRYLATAGGEQSYTEVDWQQPAALIIGSEAEGAGEEAYRLAGTTIFIPMHAATESLNAAVAAGIILFEAFRQRNSVPQLNNAAGSTEPRNTRPRQS
jgi:RNA methyltransferase, TrmH family